MCYMESTRGPILPHDYKMFGLSTYMWVQHAMAHVRGIPFNRESTQALSTNKNTVNCSDSDTMHSTGGVSFVVVVVAW